MTASPLDADLLMTMWVWVCVYAEFSHYYKHIGSALRRVCRRPCVSAHILIVCLSERGRKRGGGQNEGKKVENEKEDSCMSPMLSI